ncbi:MULTISPECIES: hypothetical protein [unclassified Nocardioides]|uniref:hypothetical protein n=1 Tax=unclassified Nocardioides TaxID=2615069 RepID=UPI0006F21854|nr:MULTISPECIES: hypothetical protein [unclassified Nocardioides]KRA27871.1 hypothetical protein ASD81_24275 [Nocardioides sp. Root614]KRA86666.1 hypothetical protein ASD84_20845 [Nocardioides sp. Root682]
MKRLTALLTWRSAAVSLVVVALLAFSAERALAWQSERSRVTDEKAASAAATTEVEGLIDISGSTSEADMAVLLDGATAGFRSELEAQADRLQKALADNAVTATGEAVSTGVVKLADDRATVIVAAVGTVQNKSTTPQGKAEPRNYRLQVDLQKTDDTWLVSGLEFVA